MKKTVYDRIFDVIIYIVLILAMIVTAYPLLFTISMSISDPVYVMRNEVYFWPKGLSFDSYKMVFENQEILTAYYNTLWYTVVGTTINILMTVLAAYPLSRKRFFIRNHLTVMITFTMFFSGGLIPSFILINQLGLYNTRWAIVLPAAISTWNLILCRTFFQSIPDSLEEVATIDGASQFTILFRIFLPLSMPIIAVLILYYAVGHWNSYFSAVLYLADPDLQPMQIYLRKVLLLANTQIIGDKMASGTERSMATLQLRYSVIVVATLPILVVYPFLQKYFVKGVMIGSLKG